MQASNVSEDLVSKELKDFYAIRDQLFFTKLSMVEAIEAERKAGVINIASTMPNCEFRTLYMHFGRRTGASYWLANILDFLTETGDTKMAVVSANHSASTYIQQDMFNRLNCSPSRVSTIKWHTLNDAGMRGENPDFVFFDSTISFQPQHNDYYYKFVANTFMGKLIVIQ